MTYEVLLPDQDQTNRVLFNLPLKSGIIVFDSFCTLCSKVTSVLSAIDKDGRLYYTSPETQLGKFLLNKCDLKTTNSRDAESIVFYRDGNVYVQSDAIVMIMTSLRYPWKFLSIIRYIPREIREKIYRFIARYRYNIFGRQNMCTLPSPEIRRRFLK